GAAGGHAGLADELGHLGAASDGLQDLRVETVDLLAQVINGGGAVRELFGFGLDRHVILLALLVWGGCSHPISVLTQETSPGSGSGPRGSGKQLHHGHRWPVPVKKSPLLDEHASSVPSLAVPAQRCRFTAVGWGGHEFARDGSQSQLEQHN